jgi:hypothetical protein
VRTIATSHLQQLVTFARFHPGSSGANKVNDEFPAHIAFVRAWGNYLIMNLTVSENDARRFTLERYLKQQCQAGQSDPDALTAAGLSYLRRHDVLSGSR